MECKCGKNVDGTKPSALVNNEKKVVCECGNKHCCKDFDFAVDWDSTGIVMGRLSESPAVSVWVVNKERTMDCKRSITCNSDAEVIAAVNLLLNGVLNEN